MSKARGWAAQARASNLVLARLFVKLHAPYLSPTLFGLIPTPIQNLRAQVGGPLAVTDRLVMYYDTEWVESVSTLILATGLAHECLHVQLKHVTRGMQYPDKHRWNLAGDLFINGSMKEVMRTVVDHKSGRGIKKPLWEFPEWAHMPEDYGFAKGLTADTYYRLLEKQAEEKESKKPSPKDDGGFGGKPHIMGGCCGGVAGNPLNREMETAHNEEKGRSEANVYEIAKNTAQQIKQHMESGAGRGTMPGQWSELIDISEKEFDVPWRTKLANITRYSLGRARTGGMDYSRRRVSKRSYLRGITLPSLIGYDPEVLFIVDSSGSMGGEQLGDAVKVCADVLSQSGITSARWMEADVEHKREPMRVSVRDLQSIEIRGRGGTDFRPAIQQAESMNPKPHVVFYLTDGDGPAPAEAPIGIHFIWVIVPSSWARIPARWGDVVLLTDHLPPHTEYEDDEEDDED